MSFPVHDWQFWVVTALFVGAVLYLFRGMLPVVSRRARQKKQEHKATLTISAKREREATERRSDEGTKG